MSILVSLSAEIHSSGTHGRPRRMPRAGTEADGGPWCRGRCALSPSLLRVTGNRTSKALYTNASQRETKGPSAEDLRDSVNVRKDR